MATATPTQAETTTATHTSKKSVSRLMDIAVGRRDIAMVEIDKIMVEENFNVRDFSRPEITKHIEDLMESIVLRGILEPITVRFEKGRALLINGECRYRAVKLGIERGVLVENYKIPCIGAPPLYANDADRLILSYVKNTGVGFSPMELLTLVRRLDACGMSRAEIEKQMGFYHGKMSSLEILAAAPQTLQNMVERDEISPSHAIELVRTEGPKKAAEIAKEALAVAQSTNDSEKVAKVTPKMVKAVRAGATSTSDETSAKMRKLSGKDAKSMLLSMRALLDTISTNHKNDEDPATVLKNIQSSIRSTVNEYADVATS